MINAKLKSRRGSTLLFALVALAVAVVVCAVVIYAAQSNAGRIRSAQDAEQAQLTLNSAASVLRSEFAGTSIELVNAYQTVTTTTNSKPSVEVKPSTLTVRYEKTDGQSHKETLATGSLPQSGSLTLDPDSSLTALQQTLLEWVLDVTSDSVLSTNECLKSYTIRATGPDGALEDVKVKLRLEPGATKDLATQDQQESHNAEKYYLTAVLSMASSPSETITMTFMAATQESTSSNLVSKTSQTTSSPSGAVTTVSVTTIETKETLTLSWQEGSIVVNVANKKGGIEG